MTRSRAHLTELVDVHEQRFPDPWPLASASQEGMSPACCLAFAAFRLEIETIQGKRKGSQNRAVEDRDGVVRGLARARDWTTIERLPKRWRIRTRSSEYAVHESRLAVRHFRPTTISAKPS